MKADGLIGGEAGGGSLEDAGRALELLLSSHVIVVLLVNFVINFYFLVVLLLKMLFFVQLNSSETRKVLQRFINYIMCKGTFLPLVVPPKISHLMLWSSWLIFLCSLKIFQSIARDRLEKLNASPSVTPLNYFRVYSALLLVLFADLIWLDQGLTNVYSCPTCRRPLFVPIAQEGTMSASGNAIDGHALPFGSPPNPPQNAPNTVWRGAAYDPSLTPPWMNQGMDGASSSSSVTSVAFGGIQMMMRQLASASENFSHGSLPDSAWNQWHSHTMVPTFPPSSSLRLNRNAAGLRIRNITSPVNSNMSELLAMVDRVHEVLPHVPDELIVQDLLRTNNINITVNNLLVQ